MIVKSICIEKDLEWIPIQIFVKGSEKIYELIVNPRIYNSIIEFFVFEYRNQQDKAYNFHIDHGYNTLNKVEFEQFREDLRNGINLF